MSAHSCPFPECSNSVTFFFAILTFQPWISLTLAHRGETVSEVTPKFIQIFHPKAGKCCMGNHKEEEKREKRWNQALRSSSAQPAPRKGARVGKQQQLWVSQSVWNALRYSPASISLEAFDDSAASWLPGEIWPTVWKTLFAPDHTCFYSLPVVRGLFWNGTPQEIRCKL